MAYTTYDPSYSTGSTTAETAQKTGLGTAKNILSDQIGKTYEYPTDISSQFQGPATADYATGSSYGPMQQYDMQSLTGGDYDALQKALTDPITAAGAEQQANVMNTYGGSGLYGSVGGGLMSGAQADVQNATQDALSGAVAERYNIQLAEQEALANYNLDQNQALFASGAAETDRANTDALNQTNWNLAQDQANIDFANNMLSNQQQYELDKINYNTSVDDRNYTNALALAGLANPAVSANQSYDASQAQSDAASTAALYSGLGSLAGGLMGSYGDSGWTFGDIGDTISGWF